MKSVKHSLFPYFLLATTFVGVLFYRDDLPQIQKIAAWILFFPMLIVQRITPHLFTAVETQTLFGLTAGSIITLTFWGIVITWFRGELPDRRQESFHRTHPKKNHGEHALED